MSVIWQTVVLAAPPSEREKIEAKARERGHKWICDWGCGYTAPSAEAGTYTTECGYDDYPRCRNCGGN
jgi:hypothetical protein